MAIIKLLDNKIDLSTIQMIELDWDVNIHGIDYKCFRIPGYIHTIGGRYAENDYWVCPRNEEPSIDNLIEFDGCPVRYSIVINENNYIKTKWDETRVSQSVSCQILRNDKLFYSFVCRDVSYAYAKAHCLIESEINEGVIDFSKYKYAESEIIGRHIWWKGQPYTLCTYIEGQCCSMTVPGHIEMPYDYYASDNPQGVKLDLLRDKRISWFCADY